MNRATSFHIPGKLAVVGEWGILIPGQRSITLPTQGLHISIASAEGISITSLQFGFNAVSLETLSVQKSPSAQFLIAILTTAHAYVTAQSVPLQPYALTLENSPAMFVGRKKVGVGSSACTSVGIIKAITHFHGVVVTQKTIFKIAALAHLNAQEKLGSCFDIATATLEKPTLYRSFDTDVVAALAQSKGLNDAISESWNTLQLTPLIIPKNWRFAIGFSGNSASTKDLIKDFKTTIMLKNGSAIELIVSAIDECVTTFLTALENHNLSLAQTVIKTNRRLLKRLSSIYNDTLETPALTRMIDSAEECGAAAKFSGAGGGDCVIALCANEKIYTDVMASWSTQGFTALSDILLS